MKKINNKVKFYEALGFVEALMAIMIVGISSVVLMQIAVNTMQNTIQNEVLDRMTQYAVEGAEMAANIAERESSTGDNLFPDKSDWGGCFSFEIQEGGEGQARVFSFTKSENDFVSYRETIDRDVYKDAAIIIDDDDLFRIICLDENTTVEEPSFVIGRIIVGQRNSDGTITKGNLIKDYSYLTIINL